MLDNYDLYCQHEREQTDALERCPVCCKCGEHIQEDILWDMDGDLYCDDCARDEFMKPVDYYIN
jgi:hypothetical protein